MQPDHYYDYREHRWKKIPDCTRHGLTWNPDSQRCERIEVEQQIMSVLDEYFAIVEDDIAEGFDHYLMSGLPPASIYDRFGEAPLMGFLAPAGEAGGAAGAGVAGPIGAAIGEVVGVISSLIGAARQRGSDEARSGVALQASVDGIYYLKEAVEEGELSPKEARNVFRTQILSAFLSFISTLTTKSVVESRLTNQKRDLENLFEKEVGSLPDKTTAPAQSTPAQTAPAPASDPGAAFDDGYTEMEFEDGSYYFERPDGSYYYEDGAGGYYVGDAEGNLYAGDYNTGDYWETDIEGNTYYEGADGSYYFEDAFGNWSSGEGDGFECSGDPAGNWSCEDGSAGPNWRQSPARNTKQQGAQRKQQQKGQSEIERQIRQAIAQLSKPQQRAARQAIASSPRAQAAAQRGQSVLQQAQGGPRGSSSGANDGMKTLLTVGAVLGGFILIRQITSR